MAKELVIHSGHIEAFERNILEEQDRLSLEFILALQSRMEELKMSQSDMAYTLGKSRAYVSKLFTKGQNLTIKTMVELAHSLEMKVGITARKAWPEAVDPQKAVPLQCKGWSPSQFLSCSPTMVGNAKRGENSGQSGWGTIGPSLSHSQLQQIG